MATKEPREERSNDSKTALDMRGLSWIVTEAA